MNMKYESMRAELLINSYIFYAVKERFSRKYNVSSINNEADFIKYLDKNEKDKIKRFFSFSHRPTLDEYLKNDHYQQIYFFDMVRLAFPVIYEISLAFEMNSVNLIDILIFSKKLDRFSLPDIVFFESSLINPKDKRSFIAVDIDTTEAEILKAKNIIQKIQKLKKSYKQKRTKKTIDSWDDKSIQIYLLIEKELINLRTEKKRITGKAIERTVISVIDEYSKRSGKNFEDKELEMVEMYRNHYYEIKSRYNLPTYREYNKILNLIPS